MEPLLAFQQTLLNGVSNDFIRSIHRQIDWGSRMIGLKGPRGAGKTTLLLQHLKYDLEKQGEALYITADHHWFYNHTLYETADQWYKSGGKLIVIDEIHKYPRWSVELKNIYDGFPGMKVIFTASSALNLYRGEADLSRRVISYTLSGMSFREYLNFTVGTTFSPVTLHELRQNHQDISNQVTNTLRPLANFAGYLKNGYLPIVAEGEATYQMKLNQIINTVVDSDLAYIASYNAGVALKVKKLLGVIAESAPFKPNIAAIARKLDLSRENVYLYLSQLNDARLINTLSAEGKRISTLQKPEKIFLENPNLAFTLSPSPNKGTIRETFVLNQLLNAGLQVTAPKSGDFLTQEITIEVGGKSKTSRQVQHSVAPLVAADDIEIGFGNKIPIWLFGFLY